MTFTLGVSWHFLVQGRAIFGGTFSKRYGIMAIIFRNLLCYIMDRSGITTTVSELPMDRAGSQLSGL